MYRVISLTIDQLAFNSKPENKNRCEREIAIEVYIIDRFRERRKERERIKVCESSFYSETWPRLELGPCPYMHNRSPYSTTIYRDRYR